MTDFSQQIFSESENELITEFSALLENFDSLCIIEKDQEPLKELDKRIKILTLENYQQAEIFLNNIFDLDNLDVLYGIYTGALKKLTDNKKILNAARKNKLLNQNENFRLQINKLEHVVEVNRLLVLDIFIKYRNQKAIQLVNSAGDTKQKNIAEDLPRPEWGNLNEKRHKLRGNLLFNLYKQITDCTSLRKISIRNNIPSSIKSFLVGKDNFIGVLPGGRLLYIDTWYRSNELISHMKKMILQTSSEDYRISYYDEEEIGDILRKYINGRAKEG